MIVDVVVSCCLLALPVPDNLIFLLPRLLRHQHVQFSPERRVTLKGGIDIMVSKSGLLYYKMNDRRRSRVIKSGFGVHHSPRTAQGAGLFRL